MASVRRIQLYKGGAARSAPALGALGLGALAGAINAELNGSGVGALDEFLIGASGGAVLGSLIGYILYRKYVWQDVPLTQPGVGLLLGGQDQMVLGVRWRF